MQDFTNSGNYSFVEIVKLKTSETSDDYLETKWIALEFFIFKEYILTSYIIDMKFSAFS